jgi:hypothetical protein
MLLGLVSNSWTQMILPPQLPEQLKTTGMHHHLYIYKKNREDRICGPYLGGLFYF